MRKTYSYNYLYTIGKFVHIKEWTNEVEKLQEFHEKNVSRADLPFFPSFHFYFSFDPPRFVKKPDQKQKTREIIKQQSSSQWVTNHKVPIKKSKERNGEKRQS